MVSGLGVEPCGVDREVETLVAEFVDRMPALGLAEFHAVMFLAVMRSFTLITWYPKENAPCGTLSP